MGREVAVLRDGRLVQTATPRTLYRTPADLELARFLGEAAVLPGRAAGDHVDCPLGRLRIHGAAHGEVDVMIRPEQVRLLPVDSSVDDDRALAAVVGTRYYGAHTAVQLELRSGEPLPLTARVDDHAHARIGELVRIAVHGQVAVYPANRPVPHTPCRIDLEPAVRVPGPITI
jgi:iron(III) transport system ATP-binding protein